jgi:two-component system, NtrC family, nitrogen regulation sensor histidine kinase NtrY
MQRATESHMSQIYRSFPAWAALGLVGLGTAAGLATFLILTGLTPFKVDEQVISYLLFANGVLVLLMAALVASQVIQLLIARSKGTPGAGLHIRLITLFSIVAVVPALLVALFAAVTLNRGLDSWFSDRTRSIVDTAAQVAEAYQQNASEATRSDLANIAADINEQRPLFDSDRKAFVQRVARHALLRNLAAAFIFNSQQQQIETNVTANDRIKFIEPTLEMIAKADKGEIVLVAPEAGSNLVMALIKLQNYDADYMMVYRILSPVVVDQLQQTRDAKAEYDRLMKQRLGLQLTYGLVYAMLALVFLLASIWMGLRFSDRLVEPIVRLLNASRRVAQGDFDAKVAAVEGPGDLITLTQTFNMMTDQIRMHRDQLIETNEQLDDRRRFTEAMLSGVSAGVIGIDRDANISLVNRSTLNLLEKREDQLVGRSLFEAVPAFHPLFEQAQSRPSGFADAQIETSIGGRETSFFVRITTERSDDAEHGYVLTFDDITSLVSAQRNSAWSDIARRIAHEIKNPLTPIQLSAERLKRKYLPQIVNDRKVFEQCTDTIIRQVGDLGRIVDEFSSFARMPKAVPESNDLVETVRDATVLQRVSSGDVQIELVPEVEHLLFAFDRRLVTQAITNLVKNARESIEARLAAHSEPPGLLRVETGIERNMPFIRVTDNGIGLPQENRHRLAEPYMTTREKGTGLGLAIVKRIMEEHGGTLILSDNTEGVGAQVTLRFAALHTETSPENLKEETE